MLLHILKMNFQVSLFCITLISVILTCYYFIFRVVVSLLARLLKFWQMSLANAQLLYLMYLKSFPPDMKSLECQCWLLMQEHVESGLVTTYIEHHPVRCFVINTHAFYNAHLLRSTLPCSLVLPIPLHQTSKQNILKLQGTFTLHKKLSRLPPKIVQHRRSFKLMQQILWTIQVLDIKSGREREWRRWVGQHRVRCWTVASRESLNIQCTRREANDLFVISFVI